MSDLKFTFDSQPGSGAGRVRSRLARILTLACIAVITANLVILYPGLSSAALAGTPQTYARNWQTPASGWLYVVDLNLPNGHGQVLLVDPQSGSVKGTLEIGASPEVVLSPDGSRLYVAAGASGVGYLSEIDTSSGAVVNMQGIFNRAIYIGQPVGSNLAVSEDGDLVYILNMRTIQPGVDEYSIATLNRKMGKFLPDEAPIPAFGMAQLLPGSGRELYIRCTNTSDIRWFRLTATGSVATKSFAQPPVGPELVEGQLVPESLRRLATAWLLPDRSLVLGVMGTGDFYQIQAEAFSKSTKVERVDLTSRPRDKVWVPARSWPRSPDGTLLYVGVSTRGTRADGLADHIYVYNVTDCQLVRSINLTMPLWNLSLSGDGKYLYAINPWQRSIIQINASSGEEIRAIRNVGHHPSALMIAP